MSANAISRVVQAIHGLVPGQHIKISRGHYSHDAIVMPEGRVIEMAKPEFGGVVRWAWLSDVLRGDRPEVVYHSVSFSPREVMERAVSQVGKGRYDLFASNCEHFANWCVEGRATSPQVRRGVVTLATTVAAVGVVAWWHSSQRRPRRTKRTSRSTAPKRIRSGRKRG